MWSVNSLYNLYEALDLSGCPSIPLPAGNELLQKLESTDLDLDLLQDQLDVWSKAIWGLLNTRNGAAAQAFFYGGSLANTYWYTTIVWTNSRKRAEFLNKYRLDYLATQFELISGILPEYVGESIANSLRKWATADLQAEDQSSLKSRLEVQQKVWRDLLFEIRRPETFLRRKHYSRIRLYSFAAQLLLATGVFLLIFLMGRAVGSLIPSDPFKLFPSDETKDLSSFFAAVSGFIVVVGGIISQLSNWIKTTGEWVTNWLKRRIILNCTFRGWK
jgi:hypothetical protein